MGCANRDAGVVLVESIVEKVVDRCIEALCPGGFAPEQEWNFWPCAVSCVSSQERWGLSWSCCMPGLVVYWYRRFPMIASVADRYPMAAGM